jgi:hypothetical protein
MSFAFLDLALNDSTITQINLRLPRKKPPPTVVIRPHPPVQNRISAISKVSVPQPAARSKPADRIPVENCAAAHENGRDTHENLKKRNSRGESLSTIEKPYPSAGISVAKESIESSSPNNIDKLTLVELTPENLFSPLSANAYSAVDIRVNNSKSGSWDIFDISNNILVATAVKSSKIGSLEIKIHMFGDTTLRPLARLHSNFTRLVFHANAEIDGVKQNIAAVKLKLSKQQLDNNISASIPSSSIPATDLLREKDLAIKLVQKPPLLKCGVPVLYFGGRVKMQSVKNHILTMEGSSEKILVFGKAADDLFIGEFFHPLSPLQGICLSLPHLA